MPSRLEGDRSSRVGDEAACERFVREARLAAALRHRSVAAVFHLGVEDGHVYCAMEAIDGETVESVVQRTGPMRPRVAVRVAVQVAGALAAAERQNLVHRDLKPANIMLLGAQDEDGPVVKVIDFGLVRPAVRSAEGGEEMVAGFSGTPQFASPEQIEGRALDIRSDLYSLGCTLWFLLTGMPPFMGAATHVFAQHLYSEPPWDELRGLPKQLRRVLARLLEKDPDQRPASPLEVRRELEQSVAAMERREALAARAALFYRDPGHWFRSWPPVQVAGVVSALPMLAMAVLVLTRTATAPNKQTAALAPDPNPSFVETTATPEKGSVALAPEPPPAAWRPLVRPFTLNWASSSSWSFAVRPLAARRAPVVQAASIPDHWFLGNEPEWPDLGSSEAPFWSADFLRRRMLADEETPVRNDFVVPPGLVAEAQSLPVLPAAARLDSAGLWEIGTPDPFAPTNPYFAHVLKPFSTRLAPYEWQIDETSRLAARKVASGERHKASSSRKRASRRVARRGDRLEPLASLEKVHRSIEGFVRRLF